MWIPRRPDIFSFICTWELETTIKFAASQQVLRIVSLLLFFENVMKLIKAPFVINVD